MDQPIDLTSQVIENLLYSSHEPQVSLTTEPVAADETVNNAISASNDTAKNPSGQETGETSQHHVALRRLQIQRARDREQTRLLLMWEDLKNNEKTEADKEALENALIVTEAMQKDSLVRHIRATHAALQGKEETLEIKHTSMLYTLDNLGLFL
ncbi:MAG: hypothetical protein GOMPHAMPRED_001509 [Gomphillus americanus]|uniref:Uncharacterized protein n=1 Tax=Gomphillus americanus TaxID=1940652 RepID=A0A8H3I831_9LECA|nr:MAG: hypothetical protein GOMPHAMPRED_001509 [Gomphillus americanus]